MKSNTPGKKRISDRTRMLLTLELAIILPAASLMAFSIWNLYHMQRDKAIEAAIQRDFTHVLMFAEKRTWLRAGEMLTPVRKEFPPCPDDRSQIKPQLDRVLAAHPEFLFAILYDKDSDVWAWRQQAGHDGDEAFQRRVADKV